VDNVRLIHEKEAVYSKDLLFHRLFWKMGEGWISSDDPKVEMDRINFSYLRRE
jgi:hypothetical protein